MRTWRSKSQMKITLTHQEAGCTPQESNELAVSIYVGARLSINAAPRTETLSKLNYKTLHHHRLSHNICTICIKNNFLETILAKTWTRILKTIRNCAKKSRNLRVDGWSWLYFEHFELFTITYMRIDNWYCSPWYARRLSLNDHISHTFTQILIFHACLDLKRGISWYWRMAIVKNEMDVFRRGPDSDWQVVVLLPLLSPITDQLPSCPQKKLQLP